jgi:hypothetical protein
MKTPVIYSDDYIVYIEHTKNMTTDQTLKVEV